MNRIINSPRAQFSPRAQAVIEVMMIFAASVLAIALIYFLYGQNVEQSFNTRDIYRAQSSVDKITNAANTLFYSGAGSRLKVIVEMPEAVDFNESLISGNVLYLKLDSGNAIVSSADVNFSGTWKETYGSYEMFLYYDGNIVQITYDDFELSTTGVFVTLSQGNSAYSSFNIRNNTDETISFSLEKSFSHSDVSLVVNGDDLEFDVEPNSIKSIDLNFYATQSAFGNYNGKIIITGTLDEAESVQTVNVSANVALSIRDIMLYPTQDSFSMTKLSSTVRQFSVCNTSGALISDIIWAKAGDANTWLGTLPSITSITAQTCVDFNVDLTAPDDDSDLYDANITSSSSEISSSSQLYITLIS